MNETKGITYKNIFLFQKERSLLSPTNINLLLTNASAANIFYPMPIAQRQ
ncbi:hypothetical protein [Hoylesella nanceiensis]|nr:hypothetical protein [Hoylesella nanceiensis]MBF1429551.1 hypothetical protein [Hoylesella nanceiensis]